VREATALRAVPDEEEEPADPVAAMNGSVPLAEEGPLNGHAAEGYPRLEVERAEGGHDYNDLRIDALSLNDYRNPPARSGANEGDRPSWFRRTFRRTN